MVLRKGSKGSPVEELQKKLEALGLYDKGVDGDYGTNTQRAVVDFQTRYLVDGIADKVTLEAIDRAYAAWTRDDKEIIFPVPNGLGEIEDTFGKIVFDEAGGGNVTILNHWDDENIVAASLPIVGKQLIHKLMEPVFRAVLQNLKDKGLDGEIKQFGVWCPRHKMHNPKRGLSTHSWGISCDINWATNMPGAPGDLNPGIVDSFERYGFQWGGRWRYRDDMHFQYCNGY